MKHVLLFFFILVVNTSSWAQSIIRGVVKNPSGELLPGVSVYIGNYNNGTSTNAKGEFEFMNLASGNYDLIFQCVGYAPQSKAVSVKANEIQLQITMKESVFELEEVAVNEKADPNRKRNLEIFQEFFIGKTPNAKECKILNLNVVRTRYNKKENTLRVSASDVLEIENKALGYKIKYYLQEFEYNYNTRVVYFSGIPTFEELKIKSGKLEKILRNRAQAYYSSSTYFFKTLIQNQFESSGFKVHHLLSKPNPQRLSDSIIDLRLQKFKLKPNQVVKASDSLFYWQKMKKMPKEILVLNPKPLAKEEFYTLEKDSTIKLFSEFPLYVVNTISNQESEFVELKSMTLSRPSAYNQMQISLVHLLYNDNSVQIQTDANPSDPKALLYEGYWSWKKIADLVPLNFTTTLSPYEVAVKYIF